MSLFLVEDVHPLVYLITDSVASRGSDDYEKLVEWCNKMAVDIAQITIMSCDDKSLTAKKLNQAVSFGEVKVLSVGFEAMDHLLEIGVDEFFVLPPLDTKHRSLASKLAEARAYVYKGVPRGLSELDEG